MTKLHFVFLKCDFSDFLLLDRIVKKILDYINFISSSLY